MNSNPLFSIILPVYNQETQIENLYTLYSSELNKLNISWEILFIVNGSKDKSWERAQFYSQKNPAVKSFLLEKGGWGRAVKYGLNMAKGEILCYTNSARTNIEDLITLLKISNVNKDLVIKATRVIRENYIRKIGSILYNLENRILIGTPLWDVNGTPKIIPAKYLKEFELFSEDDLIDVELMAKLYKNKHKIIEILILSTKRIDGKSTTKFKSALKMYLGILRIRKII